MTYETGMKVPVFLRYIKSDSSQILAPKKGL